MTKTGKGGVEYGSTEWWEQRLETRRNLIRNINGLRDLYWSIGYSPSLEEETKKLIRGLSSLIDVRIIDIAEFKRRIVSAQKGESVSSTNTHLPSPCPKLLEEHAFLTLDYRLLEHLENITELSDYEIGERLRQKDEYDAGSFRTLDLPVTAVAAGRDECVRILADLQHLLDDRAIPKPLSSFSEPVHTSDLLELVSFLKTELDHGSTSKLLHEGIQILDSCAGSAFMWNFSYPPKAELDDVLNEVADSIQYRKMGNPSASKEAILKGIEGYLKTRWMRRSDVTAFLLNCALQSEIESVSKRLDKWGDIALIVVFSVLAYWIAGALLFGAVLVLSIPLLIYRRYSSWRCLHVLEAASAEIRGSFCDPKETATRLREMDRRGYLVGTNLLALLRAADEDKSAATESAHSR